jgi:hypothetical protein
MPTGTEMRTCLVLAIVFLCCKTNSTSYSSPTKKEKMISKRGGGDDTVKLCTMPDYSISIFYLQ